MNAEVTPYFDKIAVPWQVDVAKRLRELVFEAIPDAEEKLQYSKPHYRKNGKYAAVIGTAKGWVSFTIFNANEIEADFFEEGPPERKTIKITEKKDIDYALLTRLVKQAADGLA